MIDQQIEIPTKDGHTTTFISHPERGGPFPVIIFYMDAPAIREELRDMARRLATSGYYVMLPNMYYRSGVMELGPLPSDPEAPERKRMFEHMNSIDIPMVMEDTRALLAYAVIAGMIEYAFVFDKTRGAQLVVMTLMLVVFMLLMLNLQRQLLVLLHDRGGATTTATSSTP